MAANKEKSLSFREKVLIVIFIAALALYLSNEFLYKPAVENKSIEQIEYESSLAILNAKRIEKARVQSFMNKKDELLTENELLKEPFFEHISYETALFEIEEIERYDGIVLSSFNIGTLRIVTMDQYL